MAIQLNDLVQVNYKNSKFSAGIIQKCAESKSLELGFSKDFKSTTMPKEFWNHYNLIEKEYKSLNEELIGVQEISQRTLLCYRYPSLKVAWPSLINPTSQFAVFCDSTEYFKVWNNICTYYPEMKILSSEEGAYIIKYAYERFLYENQKEMYPSFKEVMACFSHWLDKGERHVQAAILINDIYNRVSTAA